MMNRVSEKISRMSPVQRALAILATVTLAVFVVGFWVGFGASAVEHGRLPRKPLGYVVIVVAAVSTIGVAQLLRALFKGGIFEGMTGFDRRYWKMWLMIGLLGVPVGFGMVMIGVIDRPAGLLNLALENLSPGGAVAATLGFLILMGLAAWLYHRAIDDHEERAYLWGSQIAYYFVALALPALWLLSRGGIVSPPSFADAFVIVLASFLVQGAVWAWFKFR